MGGHWAIPHIGKAWVSGARGPGDFDCWGLVCYVYKMELGIDVPQMPGVDAKNRLLVSRVMRDQEIFEVAETPQEFDVVVLGRSSQCQHVGIYTESEGGGVVHCQEGAGVVFVSIPQLKAQNFNNISFLRHDNVPPHKKPTQ